MGWIAWVKGLCTRAEVLAIAERLSIDPKMAAAGCMLLWEWADEETEDGTVTNVPLEALFRHADRVTGIPGFGSAFAAAGWVESDDGGIHFPNWTRYNGPTAKTRMKEAARKANWRNTRDICPASGGTKTGPTPPHPTVNITPHTPPRGGVNMGKKGNAQVPFSQRPENQGL